MKNLPAITLGTWSWGSGMAGGDQVFGNHTDAESLRTVFDAAFKARLTMWDTATVYGMGASEDILGGFIKSYPREDFIISTKFTPQIAPNTGTPIINNAPLTLECEVVDSFEVDNFTNFICSISNTYCADNMLDEHGKIDYSKLKPVLFEFPTYSYLATGDVIGLCTKMH